MAEFKVNGKTYKSVLLNARRQFHLLRRIGALRPEVMSALSSPSTDPTVDVMYALSVFSRLTDADADFVINECLSVTQVHQADTLWADLVAARGAMMFDDMTMQEMLDISWQVLKENLGPFMVALLQSLDKAAPNTAA